MSIQPSQSAGTVYDIGYQRYLGPREGRQRARRAIFVDAIRNSLGIGRGGWAKILPWLFVAPPIGIGLIFASVAYFSNRLLGDELTQQIDLPSHVTLFQFSGLFIFLFAAVMGPELTCPDRRNRVFDLYLVRPITITDYLVSKWVAFFLMVFAVTLLPQLTLWLGSITAVSNPMEWVTDEWTIVPRMIAASFVIAAFANAFVFLISAMTDRRTIASVIAIAVVMVVPAVIGIAGAVAGTDTIATALASLFDPISLPVTTVSQIMFGDTYTGSDYLHPAIPVAWCGVLVVAFAAITWALYDNMRNR